MAFSNLPLDIAQLPNAEHIEMQPMPEAHRREVMVQSAITVILIALIHCIPLVILSVVSSPNRWVFALPVVILMGGALISSIVLRRVDTKGYAVREHDVAYEVGLFWHKRVMLPINRVQHVEVSSGPLQRRFGLASLKFFTAGGSSVDLNINGLLAADAERLRDEILKKASSAQYR